MFTHLQYLPLEPGPPRLIEGKNLLFLLQRSISARVSTNLSGTGSQKDPYRLNSAQAWLDCARILTQRHPGDAWVTMGGRMLKKNARAYISDEGPVWRYITPPLGGLRFHDPVPEFREEYKAYSGKAPTYQMTAQRIVRPHEVFPRSKAEGVRAPGWNDVRYTPMMVRTIRHLLKHEQIPLLDNGHVSKHYSRLQHSLPVLTAAMFLAEPARNLRAFPINLMLLDLAERGIVLDTSDGHNDCLTFDRILWHPDALDVNSESAESDRSAPPTRSVMGPVSATDRAIRPVTERGKLHLVGGEMPASPTRGGEIGGGRKFVLGELPDQSKLPADRQATARDMWLSNKLRVQNYDYIFQKEVAVIVRWIAEQRPASFRAVNQSQFDNDTVVVPNWKLFLANGNDPVAVRLRNVFDMRLMTLNRM
jgi:hypothetical protein